MSNRYFSFFMALLLAITFLSPAQTVFAATDTATFTFTATPNPSLYLVNTTFQLSATGTNTTYPPFGYVTFFADGVKITDCPRANLNFVGGSPVANVPATCTTNHLAIGNHVITAEFTSLLPDYYASETITLDGGHSVGYTELTISPVTLPDGQWMIGYQQQFSAAGGDGTYEWFHSGDFPAYFTLLTDTGEMSGAPTATGSNTFTITAVDYAGGYGTREYSIIINKAVPIVTVSVMNAGELYTDDPKDIYFYVNVNHPSSRTDIAVPSGTVSMFIDDTAIAGCSGDDALPLENGHGSKPCEINTAGLSAGTHTIRAEYTPAGTDAYYAAAYGQNSIFITERHDISGIVFYDTDQDGIKDITETAPERSFDVNYDAYCDGTAEKSVVSKTLADGNGEFSFGSQIAVEEYCLTLSLDAGYTQTSGGDKDKLDADKYIEIGVYYPDLIFSPAELPYGYVNEPYSQMITISNGQEPYNISNVQAVLPDGLVFDSANLTVYGTPTIGFFGDVYFEASDASGYKEKYDSMMIIQTTASALLTSSINPSGSGEAVTFTFSATGEAIFPAFSETDPIPPVGYVSFLVDNVIIEGCKDLIINFDMENGVPGNFPAVCTVSTLGDGSHLIRAEFVDPSSVFRNTSVNLTQQVGLPPDITPPTITPVIEGVPGSNGWYTGDVSLTWTVTDGESAITSQTGCDPVTITADQAEITYTCSAVSTGGSTSVNADIQRDGTKPMTAVTGVEEGSVYAQGSVPQAACSSTDNLSGIAAEATPVLSGGDASGLGDITATCSGALDNAGNAGDPAAVTYRVVHPADLNIVVTDSKDPVKPKSNLTYTIVVTNQGPNAATVITLTDTIDAMTSFSSISKPRGWTCKIAAKVLTCTANSMSAGSKAYFKITVSVSKYAPIGQNLYNTAAVSSQTNDFDTADNSFTQRTRISR